MDKTRQVKAGYGAIYHCMYDVSLVSIIKTRQLYNFTKYQIDR